jgi:hypothetical protein
MSTGIAAGQCGLQGSESLNAARCRTCYASRSSSAHGNSCWRCATVMPRRSVCTSYHMSQYVRDAKRDAEGPGYTRRGFPGLESKPVQDNGCWLYSTVNLRRATTYHPLSVDGPLYIMHTADFTLNIGAIAVDRGRKPLHEYVPPDFWV